MDILAVNVLENIEYLKRLKCLVSFSVKTTAGVFPVHESATNDHERVVLLIKKEIEYK